MFKRVTDALRTNKSYASGALEEYLSVFAENLERFRITQVEGEFDEAVVENMHAFIPYRNEAIQLFMTISQYAPTDENARRLHKFFESVIPYTERPHSPQVMSREWEYDNFKFIIHELYLYVAAVFIVGERFQQANLLMQQTFYIRDPEGYGRADTNDYTIFRIYLKSLEHRKKRLKLNNANLQADLLKDRCKGTGIDFHQLAQADFVLYLRKELSEQHVFGGRWWPDTLVHMTRSHEPFEIFSRSISKSYFERAKVVLGVEDVEPLTKLAEATNSGQKHMPYGDSMFFVGLKHLTGLERIASLP